MANAAKSLINFFRDVCPHLLPKKFRGRFTEVDEDNAKETVMVYGRQKVFKDIDGIELLKKAEGIDENVNLAAERLLDDKDLRKIRYLKLKKAVQNIDKKGFKDSDNEEDKNEEEKESEEYDEEDDENSESEEEQSISDD